MEIFGEEPTFPVIRVKQIHSAELLALEAAAGAQLTPADGLIGKTLPTDPLCIVTADCLPVAVIGKEGVAFLHAGWRGLAQNILAQDKIKDLKPTYFFIGPHIHPCCYQVQEDFLAHFPASPAFHRQQEKIYFDLGKQAILQIKSTFPLAKIEMAQECTFCFSSDLFHSFRREGGGTRNYNLWYVHE
ncbi:MAG: polyphenol oxidase family protein [Pseudomonadota bacterium]